MTFAIFVTWVLIGMLTGLVGGLIAKRGGPGLKSDIFLGVMGSVGVNWLLRALGMISGASMPTAIVVALLGAALAIAAQRRLRPTTQTREAKAETWWRWGLGAVVVVIMGWMLFAPAQPPTAIAAV